MTTDDATPPSWSKRREALGLLMRGATVTTAWKVALVVGCALSIVNQGNVILAGTAEPLTWVRVAINFIVPFLVSSYGFLAGCRAAVLPDGEQ